MYSPIVIFIIKLLGSEALVKGRQGCGCPEDFTQEINGWWVT